MLRVMAAKTCPLIVKYRENTTPVAIRGCGAAPDTELTPQALAEMSEERFAEVLNELQARGDKQRLMQPFWTLA